MFDCIIMNPPYKKSLHLQILAVAATQAEEVVNLSPGRWIKDPLADYKAHTDKQRYFHSIVEHIKDFEEVDLKKSCKSMDIGLFNNLLIYHIDQGIYESYKDAQVKCKTCLFEKVTKQAALKKIESISDYVKKTSDGPIYFNIPKIHGHGGKRDLWDVISSDPSLYWTIYPNKEKNYIITFDTLEERENFRKSLLTTFYRYLISTYKCDQHNYIQYLPWLGNFTHPRTGLKGYKSEWTTEDLEDFYELSPGEREIVYDTIENFDKK